MMQCQVGRIRAKDVLYLTYPLLNPKSYTGDILCRPSRFLDDFPKEMVETWGMNGLQMKIRSERNFKIQISTFKEEIWRIPHPPISVRPVSWAPSSMEKTLDLMSPLILDLSFSSQRWEVILPSTLP